MSPLSLLIKKFLADFLAELDKLSDEERRAALKELLTQALESLENK